MDWGLISIKDKKLQFRQRILWPVISYYIAVIINLVLRFSWASNRFPYFNQMHASHLVLIVELAEVFRRSMWNLLRIEW